ncbi:GNAT family N-acetyltransferase [Pontibacter sp. SGAir0037]|uniref:GNAT family N-acetyltransferase n=1 Tax=Pontibacter sp. SGAir0037 TaxID=2571030 RepID=UPI0010CD2F8B|nr:GNAT family N-acetyltransferase [Pontibacter sp. SGAir0037]QCR22681.1 GNAT family N-acetyltransferase [Pontibacter sp. SGAir0037]
MLIQKIKPENTWPIRQQVMWPDKPLGFVQLKEDDQGTHYGLFQNSTLTSVISCFEKESEMQFRKFATLTEAQGQGCGSYLLKHILGIARKKGIGRIWCNARKDKSSYYEKFGLVKTKDVFLKEGVEFIIMELVNRQE